MSSFVENINKKREKKKIVSQIKPTHSNLFVGLHIIDITKKRKKRKEKYEKYYYKRINFSNAWGGRSSGIINFWHFRLFNHYPDYIYHTNRNNSLFFALSLLRNILKVIAN